VLLNELTRGDLNRIAPEAVVVLPTGATEQHGPHLPVGTDTFAVEAVSRGAVAALADRLPVVMAPVLPYGSSHHHLPFGGTMSLTTETYYAVIRDLVESLITSGFRRVMIVNGHGGNHELIQLVARDLALQYPVNLAALSYWLPAADALATQNPYLATRLPGHAGAFETSLILALRPELPRQPLPARNEAEVGVLSPRPSIWRLERAGRWQEMDGFTDSPALADPDRGRAYLNTIIDTIAALIEELHAMPLEALAPSPGSDGRGLG
jgi:creatinine amidohydrolase